MSSPFLGEIRMVGFNFAPRGWAFCNGQLLPVAQNTALFSLLGTYYGGNGTTTFALPDLRGRVPIHQGTGLGLSSYVIGQVGGAENVNLTAQQIPPHNHPVNCSNAGGNQASPQNNFPAIESTGTSLNFSSAGGATMNPSMLGANTGGGLPHTNIQPYLCITFVISLQGSFPSRN